MEERALKPESPRIVHWNLPASLRSLLGETSPDRIDALGNLDLLSRDLLAVFCSARCPGSLLLKAHDLAQELKFAAFPIISGFHSPVEQEMLRVLLQGSAPLILCPARSLDRLRVRAEFKKPLADGRLLLVSPFAEGIRRATQEIALQRNQFVAALARWVFVAYASPGGKLEAFCRALADGDKPVFTFESEHTHNLLGIDSVRAVKDVGQIRLLLEHDDRRRP